MKREVLLAIILISVFPNANGQTNIITKTDNLHMKVKEGNIIIGYDILNSSPDSIYDIRLSFITSLNEIIIPNITEGDIGPSVKGGNSKSIVWRFTEEYDNLNSGLKPYLIIDGQSTFNIPKGGPEKMFLSMLLPGLGDYFVANTKEMTIKPYMRFASVGGFFALGYNAGNKRWVEYSDATIIRREYISGQGWVNVTETVRMAGDTHYKYFKHDAEIFYTLGAAIWIADIFWVLNQGFQNDLLNKSMKNASLSVNPTPGGAALTLTF